MPASDNYANAAPTPSSPGRRAAAVTPHNTNELTTAAKYLYVGTGGDVSVLTVGGDTALYKNVPSGGYIWVQVSRVNLTGTTAADIVAHSG